MQRDRETDDHGDDEYLEHRLRDVYDGVCQTSLPTKSAKALSKIFGAFPPKSSPSLPPICLRSSISSSRSAAAFSNSRFAAYSRILRSRSAAVFNATSRGSLSY